MALPPKIKREKIPTFDHQFIIIHARAGMGKSTLAALFPDNYFLTTEPGINYISTYDPMNCHNYKDFLKWCGELMASNHKGFVTIDTYDRLVVMATEYVLKRMSEKHHKEYKHPAEVGDGRMGWAYITSELDRVLTKLSMQFGLIIISHTAQIHVKETYREYDRQSLSVGGKNRDIILNRAEYILYIDKEVIDGKEQTVIRTDQALGWEAKDKSGCLPERIIYKWDKKNPSKCFKYEDLIKYFPKEKVNE